MEEGNFGAERISGYKMDQRKKGGIEIDPEKKQDPKGGLTKWPNRGYVQ